MGKIQKRFATILMLPMLSASCFYAFQLRAQEFEDTLEAELDNISQPESQPQSDRPQSDRLEDASSVVSGDQPNTEFERRLFRIFGKAQPVSPTVWKELTGSRQAEVYAVQSGDTLWDISQTMFGDGFFWSKLWAENSRLENPHQISVGQGIRFVAGDEDSAPMISVAPVESEASVILSSRQGSTFGTMVAEISLARPPVFLDGAMTEFTPEELAQGDVAELEELIPKPEIPEAKPSRPLLRNLPPSFIGKKISNADLYDKTGIDVGDRPAYTKPALIIPNSYIVDQLPSTVGKVQEVEMGDTVASIGQNVFVKMSSSAGIGQKFSVVYQRGKVKDRVRGRVGPVMEVGGTVEIAEDLGNGIYRATVTMNLNPIRVGSFLLPEQLPKISFGRTGARTGVNVRIIGGEFDENRVHFGESAVVYLDGGSDKGLNVGDILPIMGRRGDRKPGTSFPNWQKPIGLLKIVKVEQTVATAFIIEAKEEILPGDLTGGESLPEGGQSIKIDDNSGGDESEIDLN